MNRQSVSGFVARIDRRIAAVERATAVLTLAVTLVLVLVQVVSRFVRVPVFWTEEVARLGLVWMVFSAAAWVANERAHITVTVITDHLPPRVIRALDRAVQVIVTAVGALLAFAAAEAFDSARDITGSSSGLSRSLLYLPALLGLALIAWHSAVALIDPSNAPASRGGADS